MTYDELLEMSKRVVSAAPQAEATNLLDVVQLLNLHGPQTRAIAADKLATLLSEFIEEASQQAARATKH